jgi:hypothetical protein
MRQASLLAAALLLALPGAAFAQGCPPGTVDSPNAPGHCCWPGQIFSREAGVCRGLPQCPPGYAPMNEACAPVAGAQQPPPPMYEQPPPMYGQPPPPLRTRTVPYDGGPIPNGAKLTDDKPLKWLGYTGLIGLAVNYLVSVVMVFATTRCNGSIIGYCRSYSGWLFVPLAGPWVAFAQNDGDPMQLNGEVPYYLLQGILQPVSLAAMIIGFAYVKQKMTIVEPVTGQRKKDDKLRWTLLPSGPGGPGLTLAGAF